MKYSADITAGSLKVPESRVVAGLLLRGISEQDWKAAITEQNVLQSRNPASSIRVARLVRKRLELMQPELWQLVRDGSGTTTTHAVLAAAVKHSPLLGDFLDLVVREQWRLFSSTLPKTLWADYLHDCRGRDPDMPLWNESTQRKTGTVVYHILEQAGYIESTRTLKLQAVHVSDPVVSYLTAHGEDYVLRCLQVTP